MNNMQWIPDNVHFDTYSSFRLRIHQKQQQLAAARPLPAIALAKIKEALSTEWTYNSNGIEGNSLTLRETHVVLSEGFTIRGKSLREHFEVHNHDKAIALLYKMIAEKEVFTSSRILDLHALVLRSIEDDFAGRLRNGGVRIAGANFIPPNARKVADLLDELVSAVVTNPTGLDLLALVTIFHHRFVWIHPFFDGNGRTVRLAMNLILMQHGYPPAIILKNDRAKYYSALNAANKGNYKKLYLLMAQAIERSLNIYISLIPGSDSYFPIATIVEEPEVPYGQEYVSLLARTGKIDAYKEGRNWVTTKAAVLDYVANK